MPNPSPLQRAPMPARRPHEECPGLRPGPVSLAMADASRRPRCSSRAAIRHVASAAQSANGKRPRDSHEPYLHRLLRPPHSRTKEEKVFPSPSAPTWKEIPEPTARCPSNRLYKSVAGAADPMELVKPDSVRSWRSRIIHAGSADAAESESRHRGFRRHWRSWSQFGETPLANNRVTSPLPAIGFDPVNDAHGHVCDPSQHRKQPEKRKKQEEHGWRTQTVAARGTKHDACEDGDEKDKEAAKDQNHVTELPDQGLQ